MWCMPSNKSEVFQGVSEVHRHFLTCNKGIPNPTNSILIVQIVKTFHEEEVINFQPPQATNQKQPKKNIEEVLTDYMKTTQNHIEAISKNREESRRNTKASIKT
jgi:hypothetical protein